MKNDLPEDFDHANPHEGLAPQKIRDVKARAYPAAPAMDPRIGDMTPAFYRWLYQHDRKAFSVRYHGRLGTAELKELADEFDAKPAPEVAAAPIATTPVEEKKDSAPAAAAESAGNTDGAPVQS